MRRIFTLLLIALAPVIAAGQITQITAAKIVDGAGKPLAHGQIDMLPVTLSGAPIQPQLGGGGVILYKAAQCLIVNGAITTAVDGSTCTTADTSLSNQKNFCYKGIVKDTSTTPSKIFPPMNCLQPSGTTWNLDTGYVPAAQPNAIVQTGPTGPQGVAGPNCASGSSPSTCNFNGTLVAKSSGQQSDILGVGGRNFNLRAYGAVGDGSTDDSAAISAWIAAQTAAGGGVLFVPTGNYLTSTCGFVISKPTVLEGVGQKAVDSSVFGSQITCSSTSNSLFTYTGDLLTVRDIALNGPTSGSETNYGLYLNTGTVHGRYNIQNLSVNGFKDSIYVNAGAYWSIRDTHIINPIRYGLNINNVLNNDEGDWRVDNFSCVGGSQVNTSTTPGSSACIAQFSSGGGKISAIKSNSTFTNGVYANLTGSQQLLMTQLDIENVTTNPVYIAQGWPNITITGSYLNSADCYSAIYGVGLNGFAIAGNILQTGTCGTPVPAIVVQGQYGTVGANWANKNFSTISSLSPSQLMLDYGAMLSGTSSYHAATVNISCSYTGCPDGGILNFLLNNGGTPYVASIAASYGGNGVTITLPRNFAGKGLYVKSPDGVTRLYVESSTGKITSTNQVLDDGSGNASFGGSGTFAGNSLTVGKTATGGANTATLVLQGNNAGAFTSSITSDWGGNGMIFKLPRTLAGKGYRFQDAGGSDLFYTDSSSGNTYTYKSGAGSILKAPNGTCYLTTVSNAGALTTASTTCPF